MKDKFKQGFASQSLFAIMMLVLFIGILVYGYNSIISVQTTLNEEELKQTREVLLDKTDICKSPSQKGRFETIEVSIPEITHICYLKDTSSLDSSIVSQLDSVGIFKDSTIILLNGPKDVDFSGFSDMSRVNEFVIFDILPLENNVVLSSPNNECIIQENGAVNFQFQC